MDSPLSAKFRWSLEEWEEFYRCHYRQLWYYPFKPARGRLRFEIRLLIYPFIFLSLLAGKYGWYVIAIALVLITISLIWFGFYCLYTLLDRHWSIHREYLMFPEKDAEIKWHIDQNTVVVQSPYVRTEFQWEAVIRSIHTLTGLLLYLQKDRFFWLPAHAFANSTDYEKVVALAKSKVTEFYELRR